LGRWGTGTGAITTRAARVRSDPRTRCGNRANRFTRMELAKGSAGVSYAATVRRRGGARYRIIPRAVLAL